MRVVVVLEDFPGYSETFIRRHVAMLGTDLFVRRATNRVVEEWDVGGHVAVGSYVSSLNEPIPAKLIRRSQEVLFGVKGPKWPEKIQRLWGQYVAERKPDVALAEFGTVGAAVAPFCVRTKTPLVVHFHGFDASSALRHPNYVESLRRTFPAASAVIAVSYSMQRRLEALGCPGNKVHVIPCGAPVESFQLTNLTVRHPCRFLSVARFVPVKGPLLTLQAFERCLQVDAELRLTMVGDGPLLNKAKAFVKKHGIGHSVDILGRRTVEQVQEHMAENSVFVQHSITDRLGAIEGWPVGLAEAAANGLSIVATIHGGIPDQVIDGKTGYLVPEGDWQTMAEKMLVLARDPQLRHRMGQAGRENIEKVGNLSIQIEKLRRVLEQASESKPPD